MHKQLKEKLNKELAEFREKVMQKSKEEIFENSYKITAYEEIFFLFLQEIEGHSKKNRNLIGQLIEEEELIGSVYSEALKSEDSFPRKEHVYSYFDKL